MSERVAIYRGDVPWSAPVAEKSRSRTVLKSAGRTALTVLRQTKQRAKLGTLHLPIDLHPLRQKSIVLSAPTAELEPVHPLVAALSEAALSSDSEKDLIADTSMVHTVQAPALAETRALRSRLAVAERRVQRLRQVLERERRTRAQATVALAHPQTLIDHLVSDLRKVDTADLTQLRHTVTSVLTAYGFETQPRQVAATGRGARPAVLVDEVPSIPGWDRSRLQSALLRIQTQRPEIGDQRILNTALRSLIRHSTVTPASVAADAGLSSSLARHRLRLALEGLCVAGIARREGERFTLLVHQEALE